MAFEPVSDKLPRQIYNAYGFQAFNAISWQISLGPPLILFARDLEASATTLGLLAGLAPLMNILQLPASWYAEQIGYRKFMLMGWSSRVGVLILLSLLPLLRSFLTAETIVNLLLAIIFFFTLLRGISGCAWLPWISSLVPESARGLYLGRDRSFINIASVTALFTSGAILAKNHGMGAYAAVFFVSFFAGAISLYFLNRIPDTPLPMKPAAETPQIGWLEVLRDVPFQRLLSFSVVLQLAISAQATFGMVFLREEIAFSDGTILCLTACAGLLGMVALNLVGRRADRVGSKPFLGLVWLWWLIAFLGWFLLSVHATRHRTSIAMALLLIGGFFSAIYELSLTRLLLNVAGSKPRPARYFALYAVTVSLVLGLMPVPWGMVLDGLKGSQFLVAGMELNRFSVFFATEWLLLFAVVVTLIRLKESRSQSAGFVVYEIFVGMPTRGISLLLQRFR